LAGPGPLRAGAGALAVGTLGRSGRPDGRCHLPRVIGVGLCSRDHPAGRWRLAIALNAKQVGIGLDSYSYHRYFGENTPFEQPRQTRWTTAQFLKRAAELGVTAVSLQTVYLPPLNQSSVAEIRRELDRYGLEPVLAWGHPAGLDGGEDPAKADDLSHAMLAAKQLGCSLMRIVCGNFDTGRIPISERMDRLVPILRRAAAEAKDLGLTLAVENHADFKMRELIELIDRVIATNLGICLDTGNTVRVGDDLMEATALAAPRVKMVHLKDLVVIEASRGNPSAWWPSAPLGRGHFDIPAFVATLAKGGFGGTLFIEMANTFKDWPDEDVAVAESVGYLRNILAAKAGQRSKK
jgi:sugar phosphate isomerase/epimerase